MSKILKAAEQASTLLTNFSKLLATADMTKAQSLPLVTATSLILIGTESTEPAVLALSSLSHRCRR